MKTVILAGGRGTRLSEETISKPKVLVEIGGKPILWHLLKIYSDQGYRDFIICLGHKGYMIKEYFFNYALHNSDIRIGTADNSIQVLQAHREDWSVTLVDTGENSNTGQRLFNVRHLITDPEFFFTYGDGLANVNLNELMKSHHRSGTLATLTAVSPPGRFGVLEMAGSKVLNFQEKIDNTNTRINGGFFILNKSIFDLSIGENPSFEYDILPTLAQSGQLSGYLHNGFWQAMDTLRDKELLESLCYGVKCPWLV